jgi:hypothetical protein
MTNLATPKLREFAEWLLAYEAAAAPVPETSVPPEFRVCEKLRRPLTMLAGSSGYHSLMLRALTLAQREAPSLGALQVKADGSLWDGEVGPNLENHDAVGGALLVAHLTGLLFTFIGETLTLRLMHDVWPDASFDSRGSIGKANTLGAEGTRQHEPQG